MPIRRRIAAVLLAAVLGVTGCATRQVYTARPLAADEYATVRDRTRVEAKMHCGRCHQSSLPTANPAALAIYDLDRDDWATMLTPARLQHGFPRRLNARLDAPGREQLRRFIEAELALRAPR